MSWLWRPLWLIAHVAVSVVFLGWMILTRRGRPLVLTHYRDLDCGWDRQMGPLVQALGRCSEVTLVPLGPAVFRNCRVKRRPFVSHAAILAVARVLHPWARTGLPWLRARTRVARWMLHLLEPRAIFLIDESGSGQPLLRAGRELRIKVVGIQHGDLGQGNRQYDPSACSGFCVEPADVLCVWSPWFRERLLRVSPIYTDNNIRVTGRLRYPSEPATARQAGPVRVLILAEADASFAAELSPFLEALEAEPDIRMQVRAHPASGGSANGTSLDAALSQCDVVLGRGSSALLEALWFRKAVIVFRSETRDDPLALVASGLAMGCSSPATLPGLCRSVVADADAVSMTRATEKVWGGGPEDTLREILATGGITNGLR